MDGVVVGRGTVVTGYSTLVHEQHRRTYPGQPAITHPPQPYTPSTASRTQPAHSHTHPTPPHTYARLTERECDEGVFPGELEGHALQGHHGAAHLHHALAVI